MNGFALDIIKQNENRLSEIALVDKMGTRKITWESLLDRACRVAGYARRVGLKGVVPVHMDSGMEVTATFLGLNLAGVGVAPLSLSTPKSRIDNISAQVGNKPWTIEDFEKACECAPAYELCSDGEEASPAYLVFTSGSTGTPKGVMLSNKAMSASIHRHVEPTFYGIEEGGRVFQSAPLSFIALIPEIFAPLYGKATVYFFPEKSRGDVHMVEDFVNRFGITNIFLPPQIYRNFEAGPSIKCVLTGSDKITNLGPKNHRLINLYGMSETAAGVVTADIKEPMEKTPIGFPYEGYELYILDEDGNRVADGEEGEICISGCIADGYFGMDELTKETFTPNPFSDDPEHLVLLHTGDIGRKLPGGDYLYLNRKDNMIKVNGQRVEPGEIEVVLANYPGIDVAVAKGFTDENQRSIICAYYTSNRELDEEDMRKYLASKLPHYMVPALLKKLDAMPLNANGKLNRKALELPDLSSFLTKYEKPVGEAEEIICDAIAKTLGLEKVGRSDDFFRIGGDSISALSVIKFCEDKLSISTGDIFAGRTAKAIALLAEDADGSIYKDLPEGLTKTKLTDSQMGILLECGLDEATSKYNIPMHLSFDKAEGMTADSIKTAVDAVIKNHPALYARIAEEDGEFYMLREDFPDGGICKCIDIEDAVSKANEPAGAHPVATESAGASTKTEAGNLSQILADASREISTPTSLGHDPLCKAFAYICEDKVHIFMNTHHVVSDGTSVSLFAKELNEVLKDGELAPEGVDAFALYEAEQRIKASKAREEAQTYYENLLGDVEIDSNLIPDHKVSEDAEPLGACEIVDISKDKILAYLKDKDITENTFFMGVYAYALAKMTGQSESSFGVAESGRGSNALSNTVSMIVKTLPAVIKIDEEKAGIDILTSVQKQFFATMRNDSFGFNELAKEYNVRSDVMYVYQGDMLSKYSAKADAGAGDTAIEIETIENSESLSNLGFMVLRLADSYRFRITYRKNIYDKCTIDRFVELYKKAIDAFIAGDALKNMELIGEADKAFLDKENDSNCGELVEETIIDIFEKTVSKLPDKTAIIAGGRSYTYAQVDDISDRIAGYLVGHGIGSESVVSVLIPRNEYMMIASLGIMKAGAAYQPLDPSYPEERLTFMTQDAKASVIIKDRSLGHILPDFEGDILYTDEIPDLPALSTELPKPALTDKYILLYTSGTTGKPKGVMLSHANLGAFVKAHTLTCELKETSVIAQYASYGFDAHMGDLYPTIYMGATVIVIPEELRLDLAGIKEFIEANGVTHVLMTTQVARQFAIAFPQVKGLEALSTGGEKLVSFDPKNTYKINNLYGPTEGTVCSTGFVVDKYYDDIPIGKGLHNYRLFITDNYGRRVPVGVPGELVQCGPQVGLGYLGRPDLTEKVFVPNTYETPTKNYEHCYKTGDIVRFLNDGNIEYIGRRDHQVKIRGFRIELGEVEKAILDYPAVKMATITVIEGQSGKNLCAYVVSDEKIDATDLGNFIKQSHPAYMVPAIIMQIDSIPTNANGKVDKKKLPVPETHFDDIKKPEGEMQTAIFECVAEAIGADGFGVDTDIYMAGLSSIGSIRLCTLLAEKFDVSVKIRDLKRCQTVEGLEKFVREARGEDVTSDVADVTSNVTLDVTSNVAKYGEAYPITKTMEGIFIECLQRPGSTIYNMPYMIKLGAGIDEEKLKQAVVSAVEAHPCMKAELFTDAEGKICQHRKLDDEYTISEIKTLELTSDEEVGSELITPFELTNSRLFEMSIIHAESTFLLMNVHHIISDGTSMSVFIKDIEKAYAGETLEGEKYSSFDVASEEKASRTKAELKAEEDYYSDLLSGLDKDFLPAPDRAEGAEEASGVLKLTQVEADANAVANYCKSHKTSMNAYFVSAFGTLLASYAGTDYSVFNTIYNGRNDSRLGSTVAMLVKTLPVVCHIDKETVAEVTSAMGAQLMDSMSNDLYSFAEITKNFGVRNDVMFIFQGDGFVGDTFCGEKSEVVELKLSESKMAMSLQVMVTDGKLHYEFEYDTKKFTEGLAKAFVMAFDQVVASFAKEEKLADVSYLSKKEEAEMERYNATEVPYDKSRVIADFFTEQVKAQPDALCVEYHDKKYTFAQVGDLTAKLAYFLASEGVGRGDIVAILINRDENMVIDAHGVIRAGAAYLGLDPTYPPERLEFMINDSGAKYLVADRSLMHLLKNYEGKVIYTDEVADLAMPSEAEIEAVLGSDEHHATPEDNALIVYSSGTTGLPKGSILRQRNIVCFYHNYTTDMEMGPGEHVATYASFGFDGGAMDVFCSPMSGSALHVIPDEIRMDLSRLEQFYIKNEITTGFMTTQVGCMFIANTKSQTLKYFFVGGEKLIPVAGPDWITFRNGYGPSETMCYVNKYTVTNSGKFQPIGTVSNNTKEYIVNKHGKRLPYGACGELCIAGGQVGKGYLNRPEKTAESFVTNPFSDDPDYSIMYRTGDIVRMLPDGNYDFVGRRDGQVKIRGFRIELSEVEGQIRKFPGITSAVVKAFDNPSGGKFLAAYVVMSGTLDTEKLSEFIGKEKPDYMIPATIMQVDDIPLTSNGKVDMAKLPKPELGALKQGAEPANEIEETICNIFRDVLGIDKAYADDDFFKIGGSSISAIQVVVKCEHAGYPIVYKNLFANPTAQKLAEFITGGKVEKDISASDFSKDGKYDYSALKYNVIENLGNIRNDGVGDVLLTGVTGFLGSHVYRELIESTSANVICLVRSKEDLPADIRFEMMMTYYFEDWYTEEMSARTIIIDGELEDDETKEKLEKYHFNTIINCAANVKHFAVETELMTSNFSGVENLIELAEKTGAKLVHISSLSVSGESVNGSVPAGCIFKESDLNIGQSLENKYIYTKYLGEQAVIDAVSRKRIRGKIIRLGNLMARVDDNQFQLNANQNGMLRMFLGFTKLGCYPVNMLDAEIEFSPIDCVAKAVVLLAGTQDEFTVFHARNCNSIHYGYLIKAIMEAGYPIEIVEDDVFEQRLQKALENGEDSEKLGGLLAYRNNTKENLVSGAKNTGDGDIDSAVETRIKIATSITFTTKALYRLGFDWPLISMDYLKDMVKVLVDLDFFEA